MPTTRSQKRKASSAGQHAKKGVEVKKAKKQKASKSAPKQTPKKPLIMALTSPSQHASVAPLEKLPEEVLLLIMKQMGGIDRHKTARARTCYNLALTSRRLNRAANDCLYESFNTWEGDAGKFTRTLIENAALAARVKILRWNCNICPVRRLHPKLTKPTSSDGSQLRESLQQLGIPTQSRPRWLQLYFSSASADVLKVALLHTPNLNELMVNNDMVYNSNSYLRLLEHGMNGSLGIGVPDYSKIQTVDIIMSELGLNDIYPLFSLPRLSSLTIGKLWRHYHLWGVPKDPVLPQVRNPRTSFSSITNLTIANSYISSEAIVELVSSCRALSSFGLTGIMERHPRETYPKQFYPSISKALERHKATLHTIIIGELSSRRLDGSDSRERGKLSTFATFPRLLTLAFPFDGFAQADRSYFEFSEDPRLDLSTILPCSLRSLSITVYWEEGTTSECSVALSDLAKVYRVNFPHLSKLNMEMSTHMYADDIKFQLPGCAFLAEGLEMTVEQGNCRCPFREFKTRNS